MCGTGDPAAQQRSFILVHRSPAAHPGGIRCGWEVPSSMQGRGAFGEKRRRFPCHNRCHHETCAKTAKPKHCGPLLAARLHSQICRLLASAADELVSFATLHRSQVNCCSATMLLRLGALAMLEAATRWQLSAAGCATYDRLIRQLLLLNCQLSPPAAAPQRLLSCQSLGHSAARALLQGCGGSRLAAQARLNMTCEQTTQQLAQCCLHNCGCQHTSTTPVVQPAVTTLVYLIRPYHGAL